MVSIAHSNKYQTNNSKFHVHFNTYEVKKFIRCSDTAFHAAGLSSNPQVDDLM